MPYSNFFFYIVVRFSETAKYFFYYAGEANKGQKGALVFKGAFLYYD